MHINYVLNLEAMKTVLKGLNWSIKPISVKFEWFNTDYVDILDSQVSMHNQVIFYDQEQSINFPIFLNIEGSQKRKSFNINQINWIIIDSVKYDIKANLADDKVYLINSNIEANKNKEVKVLIMNKVA